MPDPQPVPPAVTGPAPETITQAELAEAFEHEIDGCYAGGREFAVNVFAYVRERRAPDLITEWPPAAAALDDLAALRRSARILASLLARNHQVMEAARIEDFQNGANAGMQWILNSLPDVWDDPETAWDGKESAEAWFDRTESFYRAPQDDAAPPAAAAPDRRAADIASVEAATAALERRYPGGRPDVLDAVLEELRAVARTWRRQAAEAGNRSEGRLADGH